MLGKGGMIGRGIGINMQQQPGQQKMQQQQQPGQQQMGQQQMGQQSMGQQPMGQQQMGQQQMGQQQMGQPMGMGMSGMQSMQQQQQQYPATTTSAPQSGGMFSTASSLFSGATNAATGGLFNKQPPKGVPQVIPQPGMTQQPFGGQPTGQMGGGVGGMGAFGGGLQGAQQPQQPGMPGQQGPNLMQKLNEITAPGGDILSKGKELIFMKFGLGGK